MKMNKLYSIVLLFLLMIIPNISFGQNITVWPNYPTVVNVVQPVVVQEVVYVPFVQNRVVYQQQPVWVYYYPQYFYTRPYGCGWFWRY